MTPGGPGRSASRQWQLWAARQVIRQHEEPEDPDRLTGTCGQCPPTGECRLYSWARAYVAAIVAPVSPTNGG